MRANAPWWALVSSAAAPVVLIGGWMLAAPRQPDGFDNTVQTISALAARDATDRWLMTAALSVVGVLHVVTALGLPRAATAGRVVLGLGGVATVLVAAFPLPASGSAPAHAVVAGVAFGALAAWPAVAWHRRGRQRRRGRQQHGPGALRRRGPGALRRAVPEPGARPPAAPEPWALRPVVSVAAALVLLGLVAWFAVSLGTGGRVGLAERFAAAAQACWPLIAVLSSLRPGRALAPAPNAARRH